MWAKLVDAFQRNYLDRSFSLEHRIFTIFLWELLAISLVIAISTTVLSGDIFGIAIQWASIVVVVAVLFAPSHTRIMMQNVLLCLATFVYIPFLISQVTGFFGPAILLILLGVIPLTVAFKGVARCSILVLNMAVYVAFGCISYQYPWLFTHPLAELGSLALLIPSMICTIIGLGIMARQLEQEFFRDRNEILHLYHELEESNETLSTMVNVDPLTGAYLKRYLYEQLVREIDFSERSQKPFCILMIEIDQYDELHASLGKEFGNKALQEVSDKSSSLLRLYDILTRYSTSTFAIILHDTHFASAINIAERIRTQIQEIPFDGGISLTISLGLTQYTKGDTGDRLVERSNKYLHQAQLEGSNRLVAGE